MKKAIVFLVGLFLFSACGPRGTTGGPGGSTPVITKFKGGKCGVSPVVTGELSEFVAAGYRFKACGWDENSAVTSFF